MRWSLGETTVPHSSSAQPDPRSVPGARRDGPKACWVYIDLNERSSRMAVWDRLVLEPVFCCLSLLVFPFHSEATEAPEPGPSERRHLSWF